MFTGAVVGGLTGGMAGAGWNFGAELLGRALIGGTVSHVQGGKFGHGFLAAGASFAASPTISNITSDVGAQMLGEMIVGGTISEATGGSFANGAIASAMAFATGRVLSQSNAPPNNEEIMQMSDAELDAWIASRANLEFDPSTAIASNLRAFSRNTMRVLLHEFRAIADVTVSFGAQAGFDGRMGPFTAGIEANLFSFEKELTDAGQFYLNQEFSVSGGAPFVGDINIGFGRSGRGSLFGRLENRSSWNGFSRAPSGDFVFEGGAAFGVGFNMEVNLTKAKECYFGD